MKLFKKLVAVAAMAAICITMTAPMSANAAVPNCNGRHLMETEETREYVSSRTEPLIYKMDVDGDGEEEIVVDYCTEVTFNVKYRMECIKCGLALESTETTVTTHSEQERCQNYLKENGVG